MFEAGDTFSKASCLVSMLNFQGEIDGVTIRTGTHLDFFVEGKTESFTPWCSGKKLWQGQSSTMRSGECQHPSRGAAETRLPETT